MPDRTHELRAALGDAIENARQDLGPHPTPEALLAYDAGKLSAADEQDVEEHLVLCPECQGLLLDVGCFGDPDFGADRVASEMEVAAAWRGVRQPAVETGARKRPSTIRGVFSHRSVPSLLAASLAMVAVGLSMWVGVLRQSLKARSQPQLNPPVYNLDPQSSVRGRGGPESFVAVPIGADSFTLILVADEAPSLTAVEIFAGDRRLWRRTGLEKNRDDGTFTLGLSRWSLPAGIYRLELHRLDRQRETLIRTFQLRIKYLEGRD